MQVLSCRALNSNREHLHSQLNSSFMQLAPAAILRQSLIPSSHLYASAILLNSSSGVQALREKLINPENIAAGRLSKKLVTIHTDVQLPPLKFHMDYLTLAAPTAVTKAAVKAAFAELEFSQHEKRLEAIWKSRAQATNGLGKGNSIVWHAAVKPGSEIVQS